MKRCIIGLMVMALATVASAGVITTVTIPSTGSDAGSGISSDYTYTHALDFGSQTGVATYSINDVPITQAGISGNVFTGTDATSGAGWSFSGNNQWHAGGNHTWTDGNMNKLLRDMYVPFGGAYTLTLSSLTAGTQYSTRVYYRPWGTGGTRSATLTFNGDGNNNAIALDQQSPEAAHYVAYDFTASGTSMTVGVSSNAWHLYGVTNHIIPEPATGGLLLLGSLFGIGLLRRQLHG